MADCSLLVGSESLPQVKEYLRFTSEGHMEPEIDRQIVEASAVILTLCQSGSSERDEPEDEALDLVVDLCSNLQHVWTTLLSLLPP